MGWRCERPRSLTRVSYVASLDSTTGRLRHPEWARVCSSCCARKESRRRDFSGPSSRAYGLSGDGEATGVTWLRHSIPFGSWCLLDCNLKPFHHDLRSRLLGGDAAFARAAGGGGGLA